MSRPAHHMLLDDDDDDGVGAAGARQQQQQPASSDLHEIELAQRGTTSDGGASSSAASGKGVGGGGLWSRREVFIMVAAAVVVFVVVVIAVVAGRAGGRGSNSSSSSSGGASDGSGSDVPPPLPPPPPPPPAPFTPSPQCVQRAGPPQALPPLRVRGGVPAPVAIVNVTLWTGVHGDAPIGTADVVLRGGKIATIVAPSAGASSGGGDALIVDGSGKHLVPGIVDIHSHLGVYAWPDDLWAHADGNEMTSPTTPQVRAVDALDPEDPSIAQMRALGGVTTAQVLPGSGNLMGGEASVVKLRVGARRVADLLFAVPADDGVSADDRTPLPRGIKMACGENPKRVYGSRGEMPMSRMGSAWLMREQFEAASLAMQRSDHWCAQEKAAAATPDEPYPEEPLRLRSLIGLLRGEVRLHNHCYEIHDLEMMIRLSEEFNFSISSFQHVLEGYKIADVLAEHGIAAATFSDLWGYKVEAYDASVHAPAILDAAGVALILKSDHPVLFAGDLMLEAAKAHHYGLSASAAVAALTSRPAAAIGVDGRVGTVAVGRDADVVVWDRHPMRLGATPELVFVEGRLASNRSAPASGRTPADPQPDAVLHVVSVGMPSAATCAAAGAPAGEDVVIEHATILPGGGAAPVADATLVVDAAGRVACIGSCPGPHTAGAVVVDAGGGIIIPGIVDVTGLGTYDVGSEDDSHDGVSSGSAMDMLGINAIDGVRLESRHADAALGGGVITSVVAPEGTGEFRGLSGAFFLRTPDPSSAPIIDDAVVASPCAVHLVIGNAAKQRGSAAGSRSGQAAVLRRELPLWIDMHVGVGANKTFAAPPPFVFHTDSADDIAIVLRLKRELGLANVTIVGGAEAVVVAAQLAAADVAVILSPARVNAHSFMDALRAAELRDAAVRLWRAGVTRLGVSTGDADSARNLRWEAGLQVEAGLPYAVAVDAISANVADAVGAGGAAGRIRAGAGADSVANFVLYDADPLSLRSHVRLVVIGRRLVCDPQQI